MDIKLMKLTTGEEILAEIVSENASAVTMKNVLAVVLNPTREGISYGFMPWGSLTSDNKVINPNTVIYDAEPSDDLRNGYASMFGGVVIPPKTLIT